MNRETFGEKLMEWGLYFWAFPASYAMDNKERLPKFVRVLLFFLTFPTAIATAPLGAVLVIIAIFADLLEEI
jgi:hypothetical protein